MYWDRLMNIDTALYSNEKRHRQLWYFVVDTLGTSLVRHLALPVHISSSNGLMDMIGSGKVLTDVLAMRFNT